MSEIAKGPPIRKRLVRGDPIRDKIVIARRSMLEKYPFFGYIAMYFEPLETTEVPTVAVTGDKKLLINKAFVDATSTKDMVAILAHEAMHMASETLCRMPAGANHLLWNYASDIAINFHLFNPEKGAGMDIPACNPLYIGFEKYWGRNTEAIYYDMVQNNFPLGCGKCSKKGKKGDKSGQGSGDSQGSEPGCKHWHDDTASRMDGAEEHEKEIWKTIIAQAAEAARNVGSLPGHLEQFITEILQPKKDWRRELAYFVGSYCKKKFDWKIRNRRTASLHGVITPGSSPHLPKGVVGIDTSGSISDGEIRRAISEHAAILDTAGGEGILGLFDADLYYFGEVTLSALKNLPVQRGGTDFRPLFTKIEEANINPAYLVLFTDLCGPFPETPPPYPVIICRPKGQTQEAPWPVRLIDIEL